jgi:hypothetical protein
MEQVQDTRTYIEMYEDGDITTNDYLEALMRDLQSRGCTEEEISQAFRQELRRVHNFTGDLES